MKVSNVILRTNDLERALHFWVGTVGLPLIGRHEAFAFLDGGSVQIALNQVGDPIEDPSMTEVVFEVDDIMEAHAALLERGVDFEVEPREVMGDGTRSLYAAHFHDPDGHAASITGWVLTADG